MPKKPYSILPMLRPWTVDCGRFQQCTKAPGHRWHGWAQCKVADTSKKVEHKFLTIVAKFLTRKFRELFITSKTLQPNERYLPLSRLRLLKDQTRSPATCLVATQLQDVYENKVVYFQKIHTSTQIPNFVASWSNASAREAKKRPGSSLEVAVEYVCRSPNLTQGGKRFGSLAPTTPQ